MDSNKNLPNLCDDKKACCGCTACYSVCPVGAISMEEDSEGFLYPKVDEEKCIKCHKCESVCAFKADIARKPTEKAARVFAARVKDKKVLEKSSSGGIFVPMSDLFLKDGGAVACCIYNYENHTNEFRLVTDVSQRDKALGSKYMQSVAGDVFKLCENWLAENEGKKLLFVGMGCQAAGFLRYAEIKGFGDRVCTVDLICHGSPSPKIWREYISALEEKNGGKTSFITFKDKRIGWDTPKAFAVIGGKEVSTQEYVDLFYKRCALRPSCHECPYASVQRNTDITIGDFWGIQSAMPDFYDVKGNSLMLVHTKKGEELLESMRNVLEVKEYFGEGHLQPNLVRPTPKSKKREQFWKDHDSKGIGFAVKKYGRVKMRVRLKKKIKKEIKKLLKLGK